MDAWPREYGPQRAQLLASAATLTLAQRRDVIDVHDRMLDAARLHGVRMRVLRSPDYDRHVACRNELGVLLADEASTLAVSATLASAAISVRELISPAAFQTLTGHWLSPARFETSAALP